MLDEHGTVLLTVRGLRMGTGVSESSERDRVLNERLLTIEWQQRELPEVAHADAGAWLLISTSDDRRCRGNHVDRRAETPRRANARRMCWPQHADHAASAELLARQLAAGGFDGVVVLTGPKNGDPDERVCCCAGGEYVRHLVRIARELPDIAGRAAPAVRRDQERPDGAGRRRGQPGAGRAARPAAGDRHRTSASARHPDRRGRATPTPSRWHGNCWAARTRTRPPGATAQWYTARLRPTPLRPEERRTTVVDHEHDGMRLQIRTPGDLRDDGTRRVRPRFRRARDRSRSRSPRPASTSPMSSSRSAATPASRAASRSWVPTSPAW